MPRNFLQEYFQHVTGVWKRNWPEFLPQYRWLLILVTFASLADCVSTTYFMLDETGRIETHPIVRMLCHWFGPIVGPVLGKLGQLLAVIVVAIYLRPWAVYILPTVTAIYLYAAWYNIWGYQIYTPLFLRLLEPLTQF